MFGGAERGLALCNQVIINALPDWLHKNSKLGHVAGITATWLRQRHAKRGEAAVVFKYLVK